MICLRSINNIPLHTFSQSSLQQARPQLHVFMGVATRNDFSDQASLSHAGLALAPQATGPLQPLRCHGGGRLQTKS